MKKNFMFNVALLLGVLSVGAYATDVFNEFGGEAKSWLTGQLGYLVALFAFMGSVIIYAFTHKHTILFIGFIIAFLAGAGPTLAGLSQSMGVGMSQCQTGVIANNQTNKVTNCTEKTTTNGEKCTWRDINSTHGQCL
jgi:hypothetical protein